MRTPNLSSVLYAPLQPPSDPKDIPAYLYEEFKKLQDAIALVAAGHIEMTYAAPIKPRKGDIRYADGTTWNPGSGEGLYIYKSGGSWFLLG